MLMPKFWLKSNSLLSYALLPLSWLFWLIVTLRRCYYRLITRRATINPRCKVLVVGNLTVGGSGKTPVVISLAKFFTARGYKVAVISRGYGAKLRPSSNYPHLVNLALDTPKTVGDEPYLMAKTLNPIAVWIDPKRERAMQKLALAGYEIILSDDGLQHYALKRHGEMVVVSAELMWGNGCLLPAGPLREPLTRLKSANWLIVTANSKTPKVKLPSYAPSFNAYLCPAARPINLSDPSKTLDTKTVTAACAIGYPPKFFETLTKLGFNITKRFSYPDHHYFTASDISSWGLGSVIVTSKDAVKLPPLANVWYLDIEAQLEPELIKQLLAWAK